MIKCRLTAAALLLLVAPTATALDLHVVPAPHTPSDSIGAADGSLARPFTSVHDANEELRKCGGCDATISLHPGAHVLDSRGTLQLSGKGNQRWQGLVGPLGERAILSVDARTTSEVSKRQENWESRVAVRQQRKPRRKRIQRI